MIKPTKQEFDLGKTGHDQTVIAIYARDYQGRWTWAIHKNAVSQRDESQSVTGLTDDQLIAMAEAVQATRKGGA